MSILKKIKHLLHLSKKNEHVSELNMNYCGFNLFYSEGTSIVKRFIETGSYEAKTLRAIIDSINQKKASVFLDVGTNVGLISLAVLEKFPTIKIVGFEPGPHQFDLFQKTIIENKIEESIQLFPIALSDSNGSVSFFIHSTADASGDGLIDTGRAGEAKKTTVKAMRLDDWWRENGQPKIGVVKCDTEGAELLVFKGGSEMIEECKPIIILEIFHANLINYPFDETDIFNFLSEKKYQLYTLDKKLLSKTELIQLCKHESEFIAIPKL